MRLPGFIGPSYESRSIIQAGARCMNLYLEDVEVTPGKSRASLYSIPGLPTWSLLAPAVSGTNTVRGLFHSESSASPTTGILFAVAAGSLFRVSNGGGPGAPILLSAALVNTGLPATMTSTGYAGEELFVTSGRRGYCYNMSSGAFALVLATGADMCDQLDGFILVLDALTGTLQVSDNLDALTFDPTQIVQRTSRPDPWVAMKVVADEVYLIGTRTGEVYFNSGGAFPLSQRLGATFEVGTPARWSVAKAGGGLAFLGQTLAGDESVYAIRGYTAERISTHGIDWLISQYKADGGITDAVGSGYSRHGHDFYVLTFPTQDKTHVYDFTTQSWHERGKWDSVLGEFGIYRPMYFVNAYDKLLAGDYDGLNLFELSDTTYTDVGGSALVRLRQTPHTSMENKRIFFDYFELEADRGVGLQVAAAAAGYNPQIALSYSNNGGKTFADERMRSLGLRGQYDHRIRWEPCGSGRDRVWRVKCSEPVPVNLFDAYVGLTVGLN